MKHINKKTLDQFQLDKEKLNIPELPDVKLPQIKYKDYKDKDAFIITDTGIFYRNFIYNDNSNAIILPFAHPVLVYFHTAQSLLGGMSSLKNELLSLFRKQSNKNDRIAETSMNLLYEFYGRATSFIIMLMTSLEAFINFKIDKNYIYQKKEGDKCIAHYNYEQIQRWIPFDEKIKEVLNKNLNKNFAIQFPLKQNIINNLKEFRDGIIHTKSGTTYENYSDLYKKALNFKYEDCLEVVKDFINYYEEKLVEPCPCSMEH